MEDIVIKDRLMIDSAAFSQEADKWLFALSQRAEGMKTYHFSEILAKWRKTIRERAEDPYTILVCGEFKRGKSSLINAILGEDVVPVDVIPETVTYNTIIYGNHSNEAVLKGGQRLKLSDNELKRQTLERIMSEAGGHIEQLILRRPIEAIRNIAIMDTPGLNDIIDINDECLKRFLSRADAVIYVLASESPFSMSEQSFLRSVKMANPTLPIMVVVNRFDLISLDQQERIEEAIQRRCRKFLPKQKFYFLSAKFERLRQKGEEYTGQIDTKRLNELFDEFRMDLENDISMQKEVVMLSRAEQMIKNCIAEIEEEINMIRAATDTQQNEELKDILHMTDTIKETENATQVFLKKLNARIDHMETATKDVMNELFVFLRKESDTLDSFEESDIERYYPFYCVDMVHEELSRQLDENQDEVCAMLQNTPELSFLHIPEISIPDMLFDLDCRVWTKGDTLSLIGRQAHGVYSLLATYAGGLIREREISGQAKSLKMKVLDLQPRFRADVLQMVHDTYEQMKGNIVKQVSDYLNERQSQLIEREKEIEKLQRLSETRKEEVYNMVNSMMKDLEQMKEEFLHLKEE